MKCVNIHGNVSEIVNHAFNGCTSLEKIYCDSTNPPTASSNTFGSVPSSCIVYVKPESISAY